MNKWIKPMKLESPVLNIYDIMPTRSEIPEKFRWLSDNEWCRWQSKWFFSGLSTNEIPVPKKDIDYDVAIKHLSVINSSWQPKHEHKMEAVSYLASLWFKKCPKLENK